MAIYSKFSHWKRWFSVLLLVCERVTSICREWSLSHSKLRLARRCLTLFNKLGCWMRVIGSAMLKFHVLKFRQYAVTDDDLPWWQLTHGYCHVSSVQNPSLIPLNPGWLNSGYLSGLLNLSQTLLNSIFHYHHSTIMYQWYSLIFTKCSWLKIPFNYIIINQQRFVSHCSCDGWSDPPPNAKHVSKRNIQMPNLVPSGTPNEMA